MPATRCSFTILAAFLVLFFVSFSHPVLAASATTDPCANPTTNPINTTAQQAAAAAGQVKSNDIAKAWASFPKTDVGQSYCGQALITAYNSLVNGVQGLSDPFSIVGGLLGTALGNFATQTCTAVISSVSGSANSLTSLARICVPLPTFGVGNYNLGFNITGCSGGTQIPLVTGTGAWPSAPAYSDTWYPRQGGK